MRDELEALLNVSQTLLEGYIRPGCTHLTVNALLTLEQDHKLQVEGIWAALEQVLAADGESRLVQAQDMLVQVRMMCVCWWWWVGGW